MTYDNNDGPVYSVLTGKSNNCINNSDCCLYEEYYGAALSAIEPGFTVEATIFGDPCGGNGFFATFTNPDCINTPSWVSTRIRKYSSCPVSPEPANCYDQTGTMACGVSGCAWLCASVTVHNGYQANAYVNVAGPGGVCCDDVCKGQC